MMPPDADEKILVNERGVLVTTQRYRVADEWGSYESDLNGFDAATIRVNKHWFSGPTFSVVLTGWGVGDYTEQFTSSDHSFVKKIAEALNLAISMNA